ncbi:hypothetical protein J2I47_09215 [Fibrella sp. HMF5335]|uniref:Uncharacterized protein n=1 Tax=Fibrella rubiginis TaxID=2817060 RepID=A0A939GHT6_9BACT|nr:hypothetical protein [Fibrella rubiginis]MBO0936722.1 hypothetical protein [Fibrella rubiginis]
MKHYVYSCCFLIMAVPVLAQQADSLGVPTDTVDYLGAAQEFAARQGPAEYVFSLMSVSKYAFKSGNYRLTDRNFPLLDSPDSLVSIPAKRAHRQSRRALFTNIATVVPLVVFIYSSTRLAALPLTVAYGQTYQRDDPKPLLVASGVTSLAGIGLGATFNLASLINATKAVRRHNTQFGRGVPTLFNPRGL